MKWLVPAFLPILLCLSLAPILAAQSSGSATDRGVIAGTVIDAVTQQPLKGAEVRLRGRLSLSGSRLTLPSPRSVTTDASGHFVVEVAPGWYLLVAARDGYVSRDRGDVNGRSQWIEIASGQRINDVVLRLLPGGFIAGHIVNEAGKPLRGVAVEALKFSYQHHGLRELRDVGRTTTGDGGEYRISGLVPGNYFLRAKPPASLTVKAGSDKAYIPLFYPAATDRAHSAALVLRAGEELAGIDMTLAPVHTVRIQGQVINAHTSLPSREAEVTLLGDQGETVFLPGKNFSVGGQAKFELSGVPAGSYIVVAQQPSTPQERKTMWGRTSIEVGETNLDHVEVVVGPGVDVYGRIRFEGKTAPDLRNMVAILEPQEASSLANLTPDIDNASMNPDGTFVFHEVPEANYRIRMFPVPAGFYLKSSGSNDPLDAGLSVSQGHAPPPLELVLSTGAARVDGIVKSGDQPSAGATVVLVPDDKRALSADYQQARTDQMGRFAMRNVSPGNYTVFAWETVERNAYMDPDFLGQFEDRGQTVHVEESGRVSVELNAIPAEETAP